MTTADPSVRIRKPAHLLSFDLQGKGLPGRTPGVMSPKPLEELRSRAER